MESRCVIHATTGTRTEKVGSEGAPESQELEMQARVTRYACPQGSPHKFIKPHAKAHLHTLKHTCFTVHSLTVVVFDGAGDGTQDLVDTLPLSYALSPTAFYDCAHL